MFRGDDFEPLGEITDKNEGNGVYTYEVQKIEVLDEETPNTPNGAKTLNSELEALSVAKLIENVGKTMGKEGNLLKHSDLANEETTLFRDPGETGDIWSDMSMGVATDWLFPNDREQRESEAENETSLSDEVYNSTVDELQKKFGDKIETISREDLPGDKKGSKTIKAVYDPSTGTIKVVRENATDADDVAEYCPTIMVSTKLVIITPNCPSRSGNPNTRVEI